MSALYLRLYALLTWLAQPLLRRKLNRRGKQEPGYLEAMEERFGRYTHPVEPVSQLLWLHAVSLGETRTAALLLDALRAQRPGLRILLTHGTATGRAEGMRLLRPGDVQVWQPWDSAQATARFLSHFKPQLGLLMETEVWPCLVAQAKVQRVPLLLVNARLSDKSLQQALRVAPLSRPAYAALTAAYAQTDDDAARLRQLGAPVAGVFGNLKFDAAPHEGQQALGKAWRAALAQPVLMFASSREDEEALLLQHLRAAAGNDPANSAVAIRDGRPCKILLVPRHPQRFDEVLQLAQALGFRVSRRSDWTDPVRGPAGHPQAMDADIWLGDSLGEMALYYALSDVALLGGSFAPLGGQNLIEAAACGCPVLMGPHTFNFSEAAELAEAAGAAQRVAGMPEAFAAAQSLVRAPARRLAMAGTAGVFAQAHRGATARTAAAVLARMPPQA